MCVKSEHVVIKCIYVRIKNIKPKSLPTIEMAFSNDVIGKTELQLSESKFILNRIIKNFCGFS